MSKEDEKKPYSDLKRKLEMNIQHTNSFVYYGARSFDFTAKAYRNQIFFIAPTDIAHATAPFALSEIRRYNELLDHLRQEYEELLQSYHDLLLKDNTKIKSFYFKWLHGFDSVLSYTPYEFFRRKEPYYSIFNVLPKVMDLFDDDDIPRRVNDFYLRSIIEKDIPGWLAK